MRQVDELISIIENEETVRFNIKFNPKKRKEYEFLSTAFNYMKCTGESFKEAVIYLASASGKQANEPFKDRKEEIFYKDIDSRNSKKSKKSNTPLEPVVEMPQAKEKAEETINKSEPQNNGDLANTAPSSDEKKRILKEKLAKTYS